MSEHYNLLRPCVRRVYFENISALAIYFMAGWFFNWKILLSLCIYMYCGESLIGFCFLLKALNLLLGPISYKKFSPSVLQTAREESGDSSPSLCILGA